MISERRFCAAYGSLWQALTPTCDRFVRQINQGLCERLWPPIASDIAPNRRGFINEIAFQIFVSEIRARTDGAALMSLAEIARTVSARLTQIDLSKSDLVEEVSAEEHADISEQLRRFRQLFVPAIDIRVVPEPVFPGCGFLDTCKGDILRSTTLYEVKAGDRPFRSIDLRQVITYATLNYVSKAYEIDTVAIANVRSGLVFELSLNELTQQVSGRHSNELFESIAYSLASGDMSR